MSGTGGLHWFKSSYSGSQGDSCVEAGLRWRKCSCSGSQGDDCVEVADGCDAVHVRDSKVADGPRLTVDPAAWGDFVGFAAR
ncbi:DUF397 domain-containing protein [Streptomyces zhihengii]